MKRMRVMAIAASVAAVMAVGCKGMVIEPPEEVSPPAPTLVGTWTATYDDPPDEGSDEQHVMFVDTITFTADRFIQYRAHYRADGTLDSWWTGSGTWVDNGEGFVTRVWLGNHDDDDDTPDVLMRIKKRYLWLDSSRNTLLMHHWADDEQRPDNNYHFDEYTRVPDPMPPTSILGTWIWRRNEGAFTQSIVITFSDDGTFTWLAGYEEFSISITGKWDLSIANYFLHLTEATVIRTPIDGEPEIVTDLGNPPPWRLAFAPTDVMGTIVASPRWAEAREDEFPYGWYGDIYDLQM